MLIDINEANRMLINYFVVNQRVKAHEIYFQDIALWSVNPELFKIGII